MFSDPLLLSARKSFHTALLSGDASYTDPQSTFPSNADASIRTSVAIAASIFDLIRLENSLAERPVNQISSCKFQDDTESFIREALKKLELFQPGIRKSICAKRTIADFEHYRHLAELKKAAPRNPDLAAFLSSDHVIAPDVLIVRKLEAEDFLIGAQLPVEDSKAHRPSMRLRNSPPPILNAVFPANGLCVTTLKTRAQRLLT